MGKRILIIQGHPDCSERHLCHALGSAYRRGALAGGHEIRHINVTELDFALLRSQHEWEHSPPPPDIASAQADVSWAEHIVLIFPLWLGDMPALLKAFLEQVARPGFAFSGDERNPLAHKGLTGRSARLVVTMGMPALIYRWYYRAHSIRALKRNVLNFVGIEPVDETIIGLVAQLKPQVVERWFRRLEQLGMAAA
ncbi:NAD(P)H-dependent oxidoreductase [Chitinimonas sp.]|uniref:NAD(P)H-dependent oxidoreductase n=1 Tax=Chitinimonas sp. TaxID=1934313 RepID=UPI002F93D809